MVLLEIGIALVVIVFLAIIGMMYNGLVVKRNRVQDAWAQIDVQLKRRYDLIPNLIDTVKGYAKYERSVLTDVTRLRTSLVAGSIQDKAAANNQLTQALKSIFAVAENYPDLKASANFQQLQQELAATEDRIAFVRTSYNDYVLDYNNATQTVPSVWIASAFNFKKADFFQAPDEEKKVVKVDFSDLSGSQQAQQPAPDPQAAAKPAAKQPSKKADNSQDSK
jgi:LemA protein